jgi:hypothetical protein
MLEFFAVVLDQFGVHEFNAPRSGRSL